MMFESPRDFSPEWHHSSRFVALLVVATDVEQNLRDIH